MKLILLGIIVIILAGCATDYQKTSFSGGFSETQLDENVWKVTFKGNGYTREERASDLALLRCADLTLKNGYAYFALADTKASNETSAYKTPTYSSTTGTVNSYGNSAYGYANTTTTGGHLMLINKPSATNIVVMVKQKNEIQGFSFDASFICNSLGEKYQVQCGVKWFR